ncbi:MAG: DnaJ domain-containing protein [bacterium]|nr:DnaJ domain-containing protein [bacterium]
MILGLHKGATADEIKKAYVALVKKYDPEKHTERFMVIQKAFDRLKEPASRAQEDVRTFNYIKGEFFFNKEERIEITDIQLTQGLEQLESRKKKGEIAPEEADKKLIQAYMVRSWKNVQKKLWAEAIQDWKRVLTLDPTHRRAKNNLLYSYITLGYSYASHGLYDEALEVWTNASQMNPDDAAIIHNLALACEHAGHMPEAGNYWKETVKRWRAQLEREPDNDYLKNCIIEVLREHTGSEEIPTSDGQQKAAPAGAAPRAKAAKSIDDYREILKLNPEDFEAHFKIASILMNEHKWAEATRELQVLQRKHPRNIEVMNLLGWGLLNDGKVDDAFMIWRKARVIDPKSHLINTSLIQAHMTMGRMLRQKGHYTPSLVHFKALQRYQPNSAEVRYEIGKTYQMQGNERSAFLEYTEVLRLDPKHREARNGLSSLKLRR